MTEQADQTLGYHFKDPALLEVALTHASIAGHRQQSNERLEFLGDAVLGFVVCEHLFSNYPSMLEGEMTKIKSRVVSRKVCALVSEKLNLSSMLNLGKGMGGADTLPDSVAAAVFESVIAAIYLDGGIDQARQFILEHIAAYIDEAANSAHHQNFKSALQHYAQRRLPDNPSYVLLDEKGPDHSKCFEVCVEIGGRRFASAWANAKKEAEQKAALLALKELGAAEVDDAGRVHLNDVED